MYEVTTLISERTPATGAAQQLMRELATSVPGDLGPMVRAMVGVTQSDATTLSPPAEPIRWAASVLDVCCRVYGAPVERAVPVGACLALLGIASSALDAAMDGHQDLIHAYTVGLRLVARNAVEDTASAGLTANAGAALIGLAWQALLVHGPRHGIEPVRLVEIGQLIAERLVCVCEAQHRDATLGRTAGLSLEEYDEIIAGKTGQIDGTACEVGALLAGAAHHREEWRTLGAERAIAQQLYDDYRDLDEDLMHGGQIGHPVLYGLAIADAAQRARILALLERARSRDCAHGGAELAVQELKTILQELGAELYTLAAMVMHRNRALAALNRMRLPTEAHESLQEWVMRVAPRME